MKTPALAGGPAGFRAQVMSSRLGFSPRFCLLTWLCFWGLPGMAPGSPRLSPLGGVMASLTAAALASHPLFLQQEKASFLSSSHRSPERHSDPTGLEHVSFPEPISVARGGRAVIGQVCVTCYILRAGMEKGEWLLGR